MTSVGRKFYIFFQAREFLSGLGDLSQTQIFAKIENVEVNFSTLIFPELNLHINVCHSYFPLFTGLG